MAGDQDLDLDRMVEQWGQEFAIERELADLQPSEDVAWLSLAEAEKRAGVSRSTLRAWYRAGHIASRLMPGPHGLQRLVPLDAVLERAARSPRTAPRATAAAGSAAARGEAPAPAATPASEAVVRLAEMATAAATERALAAEARAAEAEAALHEALERAAAAEAEIRLLRSGD